MPWLETIRNFAVLATGLGAKWRSNTPTKLCHPATKGLASVALGLGLFPALSNVIHNCYNSSAPGSAASTRMLSQDGEIPITSRSVLPFLKPTRPVLAPAAAALLIGLLAFLPCMVIPSNACAAAAKGGMSKSPKHTVKSDEILLHCPARFITAIVPGPRGGVWVSGEDTGIYHGTLTVRSARAQSRFRREPVGLSRRAAPALKIHTKWTHFDRSNSPGLASDCITALCVDGKGRLWAGTNRHGVCVFNGEKWRHYGIVTGPLGCHVCAIAYDGYARQVWIATENGIGIYQCSIRTGAGVNMGGGRWARQANAGAASVVAAKTAAPHFTYPPHTWHYITAVNGLPPNPDCMAFGNHGTAYVGTLCNGLAIGAPMRKYTGPPGTMFAHRKLQFLWRIVKGPWHMPLTATGNGLPSNLINCVLVGQKRQYIYVGTDLGLAISTNHGQSFHYLRGSDYAAKVMGLWHPPAGYHPPPQAFLNKLLPGDHITTIAQDAQGNVWLGTWRNGYAKINTRTGAIIQSQFIKGLSNLDGYISKLAIAPDGSLLIGRYGSGVSMLVLHKSAFWLVRAGRVPLPGHRALLSGQPLPQPAKAPRVATLAGFSRPLAKATRQAGHIDYPYARFLRNDWRTQGDWVGRYGTEYALLCAANFDLSYHCVAPDYATNVDAFCGPHHRWPFESMREWEYKADTHNPKSLYIPELGYRRQTNWGDHGETYPTTFQGPDLWIRVHLKEAGIYRLSLYFFNKDGHTSNNRQRDWLVEVYPLPQAYCRPMTRPLLSAMVFPKNPAAQRWARWAMAATPLAETRVVNFWNPVYTRFAIAGPGQYMVRIVRGSSLNAEICGIFLDNTDTALRRDDQSPATSGAAGSRAPLPWMWGIQYGVPPRLIYFTKNTALITARSIFHQARHAFGNSGYNARWPARLFAYRLAVANHAPRALLARWRWRLDIWNKRDRKLFDTKMNAIFHAMLAQWKGLKQFMAKNHDLQPNSGELGKGKRPKG